jgi:hypothetical protein
MFSNADFSTPMFVHDQVPPGVLVKKEKHTLITYTFEKLPAGGKVRIKTADSDALRAIHDFLRSQIADHHSETLPISWRNANCMQICKAGGLQEMKCLRNQTDSRPNEDKPR